MQVHHWNPETLTYVGSTAADESPLEPGIFLVPAFATPIAPPSAPQERCFWKFSTEGDAWIEVDIPKPLEPITEEIDPRDPMDLLREKRNRLLFQSDWVAIKYFTRGEPLPAKWAAYFQALRDLPAVSTPVLNADGGLEEGSVSWPVKP